MEILVKRLALFLIALTFCANQANAKEVFTSGQFRAPCTVGGKECEFSFDVEMNFVETPVGDKKITEINGKVLTMYGVRACRWEDAPIKGTIAANGTMRWRTDKNAVADCGSLVFEGKKEGDIFVGAFPKFQGVRVDLSLKPKK